MNLFDLAAKITLDSSQYEQGIKQAKKSANEYRSDVMKLASSYKKQGMDMSAAMTKAYAEIDKSQYDFSQKSGKSADDVGLDWKRAAEKVAAATEKMASGFAAAGNATVKVTKVISKGVQNIISVGETAGKVVGTATATGFAGIAALTKSAVVDYYGEAEQLIGGVETLFKDSAGIVLDYANGAYKTAGLSANEYMATVTSFSASLIKSLEGDTKAAAEYADMAITDMADNANKMGTSIESIQNAYQGFAKQNYTMLDNLKLGYGGTKTEMKRLIKDAEKISGKDLSIKNYSDIIEAIHIIQEDMGITGATAAEAADTIQGSMNAASSALKNLMAGLADENADLEKLTGNVVEGVSTAAKNIVPRVKITLGAIAGLADTYSDDVANFAADMLVNLTAQAPQAAKTVTKTVKTAIKALDARKDDIAESAEELFGVLLTSFEDVMDDVYPFIERLTPTIANGFLRGTGTMFTVGTNIIMSFVRGLASDPEKLASAAFETVSTITQTIDGNTEELLQAGWTVLSAIGDGILQNLPQLATSGGSIVEKIIDFATEKAPDLLAFGVALLTSISDGVSANLSTLLPAAVGVIGELAEDITNPENLEAVFDSAIDLLMALADGTVDSIPVLLEKAPVIIGNLISALAENAPDLIFAALEIIGKLREGLNDPETLGQLAGAAIDIIGSLILGLTTYQFKMLESGAEMFSGIKDGFMEFIDDPFTWGEDLIDNFISGIKDGWSKLKNAVSDTAQKVKDFLGFSEPKEGPLSNFHTYAPDMMDLFIKGIKDNEKKLTEQIEKTFDFGEKTLDLGADNGYIATVEHNDAVLTQRAAQGGKSGGNNITVNITVEGGEYESETALAEEIARVLQKLFARKEFA